MTDKEHAAKRRPPVPQRMALAERLANYSMPEPNSGCHLWLGFLSTTGYGCLQFEGRPQFAHRLAWRCKHGSVPAESFVLHKCDNPYCINPDHLFLGTHNDNMADMSRKGRGRNGGRRGEKNARTLLNEVSVRQIRADSRPYPEIAVSYGIHRNTVQAIKAGRTWSHVQ